MAAINTEIEAALFGRAALLASLLALPIAWPNVDFKRPSTGYIRVTHVPNTSERWLIGSDGRARRRGLLQVDVFVPTGTGTTAATEMAGKIAGHFPVDLKLTNGAVTVRIAKAPDIAQAMTDDVHWMVPVTVSYECFA